MRLWPLLLILSVSQAAAFTGETVDMRDGQGDEARDLPPVWIMHCEADDRLVGLRLHADDHVTGIEAICAPLRQTTGEVRWLETPRLGPEPEPSPPPPEPRYETRVINRAGEGTVLEARSGDVRRYRTGSHAEIITIRRPDPVADKAAATAAEGPAPVTFEDAEAPIDLVCPRNSFVMGLKSGSVNGQLVAVQVICGDGSRRPVATIGEWPSGEPRQAATRRHRSGRQSALVAQRVECSRAGANPQDGEVGQAVFGTAGDGEVDSIGLSCAKMVDNGAAGSPTFARMRDWVAQAVDRLGAGQMFATPRWFDGAGIAACGGGRRDKTCNQDAADRFCQVVAGFDRASDFEVGAIVANAVSPDGRHCSEGRCHAFASIACASAQAPPDLAGTTPAGSFAD